MSATDFREQKRGGKGMRGLKSREEDSAMEIFMATTHSELMIFTESGTVYNLAVHQIPEAGRTAFGTPIINLLPQNSDKIVSVVVKPSNEEEDVDLIFCSQKGQVKRSSFSLYQKIRSNGLIAYKCAEGDKLLSVIKAESGQEILISTRQGLAMRCPGSEFRSLGRNTTGVRGIKMREGHAIASLIVLNPDEERKLLTISEKGLGKRTALSEYRLQKRGGLGIFDIKTGEKNGLSVGSLLVEDEDKIMLLTNLGQLIKIPVKNIRETGRNTKGVKLMDVSEGEHIVSVTRVIDNDDGLEEQTLLPEDETSVEEETEAVEDPQEEISESSSDDQDAEN
jgi:DNA gyrase subunit A